MVKAIKNQSVRYLAVFVFSLCISLILIVWTKGPLGAVDDGAFYTTLAKLTAQQGFIKDLPWLHFTNYQNNSSGIHWLYPILISPLAKSLPPTFASILIGTIGLSLAVTIFYFIATKVKVPWPGFWTLVLIFSTGDFAYRMLFARPIALSLAVLLVGWFLTLHRRFVYLLPLAIVYVWLYDAYILLFFIVGTTALFALRTTAAKIKAVGYCVGGLIIGLIVNPYFPLNIFEAHFLITPSWIHKLQTSNEWQPLNIIQFSEHSVIFLASLGIIGIVSFTKIYREKTLKTFSSDSWSLILITLCFTALTIRSQRFIEYAAPFAILTTATLLRDEIANKKTLFIRSWHTYTGTALLIILLSIGMYTSGRWTIENIHNGMHYSDQIQGAARYAAEISKPGDIILNTRWDQFPQLFFWNQKNYYITGLDPLFLLKHDERLYRQWQKLANDSAATIAEVEAIASNLNTSILFIEPAKNPNLYSLLVSNPLHTHKAYCDPYACVFKIY